jgi:hypothetical protein
MKRLVLILVSLLCAIQLSAQTVIITGTVYDETGEPVIGCSINTSESRSTYSDLSGHYSIPVSQNKTVEIHYECIGYNDVVLTYSPESGASFNPDVIMEEYHEIVIVLDEKPDKCIECEGKVLPIMYGLPSKEGMQALERGEYVWGGDVGSNYYENYACVSCGQHYHVKGEFVTVRESNFPDEVESITLYTCAGTVYSQFGRTEILFPFHVLLKDKTGELICQELGTRVRLGLAGHPVESIRFEGFELISVEKKTLPDQGDMDTSAYCFKRGTSKTQGGKHNRN